MTTSIDFSNTPYSIKILKNIPWALYRSSQSHRTWTSRPHWNVRPWCNDKRRPRSRNAKMPQNQKISNRRRTCTARTCCRNGAWGWRVACCRLCLVDWAGTRQSPRQPGWRLKIALSWQSEQYSREILEKRNRCMVNVVNNDNQCFSNFHYELVSLFQDYNGSFLLWEGKKEINNWEQIWPTWTWLRRIHDVLRAVRSLTVNKEDGRTGAGWIWEK